MNMKIGLEGLASELQELAAGSRRQLIALAGAPGAGKSHVSDVLFSLINNKIPGKVQILPMDGFHFDDTVLEARGDLARKGAPHTFDVGGLLSTLQRIRADDGAEVAVPVFDRSIEIARAGARIIGPQARLIIVEGNYLLLDDIRWQPVTAMFDRTVFIEVPEKTLHDRLTARWAHLSPEDRERKMDGNDLPNMRLVLAKSRPADYRVVNG
ncbi:UNVERIFIED_ORG: pantothenate kinase [Martelella mediterranea]